MLRINCLPLSKRGREPRVCLYEGFGYRMNEKSIISRQLGGRLLKSAPYMDEMKAS